MVRSNTNLSHARRLTIDPTPDEIRRRCEGIQNGWTDRERERRAVWKTPNWLPPVLNVWDSVGAWALTEADDRR